VAEPVVAIGREEKAMLDAFDAASGDRVDGGNEGTGLERRAFLRHLGAGAAASLALGLGAPLPEAAAQPAAGAPAGPQSAPADPWTRRETSRRMRSLATHAAYRRPLPRHRNNREEVEHSFLASFSKGLPHNHLGEVRPNAYRRMLQALKSGRPEEFENLPRVYTPGQKFNNPMGGLGYDLQGADAQAVTCPPAPRIDSPRSSAETAELYWMALCRDVRFSDYESDPLIAQACEDLSRYTDFRGPKQGGRVTPRTIFRGQTPGDLAGPYISQFLYQDIQYGTLTINQRGRAAAAGIDWMTDYREWLELQKGFRPRILLGRGASPQFLDPVFRYLRTGRDLATYAHFDALYEAYLNACLYLVYYFFYRGDPLDPSAPEDPGHPYKNMTRSYGFGTLGIPHIQTLVTEVSTRALKAAWFQKWFVHRRLRPEALGGRIHNHLTGRASYPLDAQIFECGALEHVYAQNGSYLLPMAYQEGAPLHPAYPSGHGVVAGACVTVLKAWFDESFRLEDPVVANASGTDLLTYTGPDAERLTVGGELDKLAWNICHGRDWAGLHWRSDMSAALELGEQVAITILEEQSRCFPERGSLSFTRFDGTRHTIWL
jgi:hypothetical protein